MSIKLGKNIKSDQIHKAQTIYSGIGSIEMIVFFLSTVAHILNMCRDDIAYTRKCIQNNLIKHYMYLCTAHLTRKYEKTFLYSNIKNVHS